MRDPAAWGDEGTLVSHLADELIKGRLGLLIGAGVSAFYGLPQWTDLVDRMSARVGMAPLSATDNPVTRVGAIKVNRFSRDEPGFLDLVQSALYDGIDIDFEKISSNRLLSAIGSLVMSSRRGSASTVITLNFDDLLEIYLEYYGFVANSIHRDKHWAGNGDVVVYHPHGFLPLTAGRKRSRSIVLSSDEFYRMIDIGSGANWRSLLITLLRTKSFIHIGLSGDDLNVQTLMSTIKDGHAISEERIAYHGVMFSLKSKFNSDLVSIYRGWGVHTHLLDSWSELPTLLFRICQKAREKRVQLER